jgi:diaminopimelate epimerase
VAAVVRGAESPVTVRLDGGELEVEVGEDLGVRLTGWAVPVYRGKLSDELVEELHAA